MPWDLGRLTSDEFDAACAFIDRAKAKQAALENEQDEEA